MRNRSRLATLKVLIPVGYMLATLGYFIYAWPTASPAAHHLAGSIMATISFGLWILARLQLGDAFSIAPKSTRLVTRGLYAKLRHPVYYFSITAVMGIGLFIWNLLVLIPITFLIALEVMRIRAEERLLIAHFGQEYITYKRQTWF